MEILKFQKIFSVLVFCVGILPAKADIELCIGKYHLADLNSKSNIYIEEHSYSKLNFTNFDTLFQTITLINNVGNLYVRYRYKNESEIPTISGGPLKDKSGYRFVTFYLNWVNFEPSSLRSGDMNLSVELHLLFYNLKYEGTYEAMWEDDGLAVMVFQFVISKTKMDSVNSGLRKMANFFEDISKNTSSSRFYVSEELTLYELLPSKFGQFKYTYIGTMIYGACERDVIWMEFEEKLPISAEEILKFYELSLIDGVHIPSRAGNYSQPKSIVYATVSTSSRLIKSSLKIIFMMFYFIKFISNM